MGRTKFTKQEKGGIKEKKLNEGSTYNTERTRWRKGKESGRIGIGNTVESVGGMKCSMRFCVVGRSEGEILGATGWG